MIRRRDFLVGTVGSVGTSVPLIRSANAALCPAPRVSVAGGTSLATPCHPGRSPAWYPSTNNTWVTLPNSILQGSPAQQYGAYTGAGRGWAASGDRNVVEPWCGGVVNTVGIHDHDGTWIPGTFLVIHGGGHNAYYGNEVYAFGPLESDTPAWHCPRAATDPPVLVMSLFNGSASGTTFTVSGAVNGQALAVGSILLASDGSIPGGVTITSITGNPPTGGTLSANVGIVAPQGLYVTTGTTTSTSPWFNGAGDPVSTHTYSRLSYRPASNELLIPGIYAESMNALMPSRAFYKFNFSDANPATGTPWSQGPASPSTMQLSCYDPVQDGLWTISFPNTGNARLNFYSFASNTWTTGGYINFSTVPGYDAAVAFDFKRQILAVWIGTVPIGSISQVVFFRTSLGVSAPHWMPTLNGSLPTQLGTNSGLTSTGSITYDSIEDRFVIWYNSGASLYTLTAPETNPYSGGNAWQVGTITASGTTPSQEAGLGDGTYSTGTYGRFNFIASPASYGYILMNRVSESVYFYRP